MAGNCNFGRRVGNLVVRLYQGRPFIPTWFKWIIPYFVHIHIIPESCDKLSLSLQAKVAKTLVKCMKTPQWTWGNTQAVLSNRWLPAVYGHMVSRVSKKVNY